MCSKCNRIKTGKYRNVTIIKCECGVYEVVKQKTDRDKCIKCYRAWYNKQTRLGIKPPKLKQYKTDTRKLNRNCVHCGKKFRINHGRQTCCSKECAKERRSILSRERDNKRRQTPEYKAKKKAYRDTDEYRERNRIKNIKYRQSERYLNKINSDEYKQARIDYYLNKNHKTDIDLIKCICESKEFIKSNYKRLLCTACETDRIKGLNAYRARVNSPGYSRGDTRACECCGTLYTVTHGTSKYCSKKCLRKSRQRTGNNIRKRCKMHGVLYTPVNRRKVFERDKWRCCNCKIKVQKENHLLDDAAELDHIVPLSIGGPHTYSNVQTLCRKCNADKSNNYSGQMVLKL